MLDALYNSLRWRNARDAALARDGNRCVVARLLGGSCSEVLHAHHLQRPSSEADPLAYDLDNLATVCSRHHPKWEAVRRAVLRGRGGEWRRCPHAHRTTEGRQQCERRLNREAAEADAVPA